MTSINKSLGPRATFPSPGPQERQYGRICDLRQPFKFNACKFVKCMNICIKTCLQTQTCSCNARACMWLRTTDTSVCEIPLLYLVTWTETHQHTQTQTRIGNLQIRYRRCDRRCPSGSFRASLTPIAIRVMAMTQTVTKTNAKPCICSSARFRKCLSSCLSIDSKTARAKKK